MLACLKGRSLRRPVTSGQVRANDACQSLVGVGRAEQQRRRHCREPQADKRLQHPHQEAPEQQFVAEAGGERNAEERRQL